MRIVRLATILCVFTLLVGAGVSSSAPAQEIVFTSNQFTPVEEQEGPRNTLLAGFTRETGVNVRFVTENEGPYVDRLLAEAKAGRGSIDVTGTLHGIFPVFLANSVLRDMAETQRQLDARRDRTFFKDFLAAAKMENATAFVPWMQATYLIVAHRTRCA